MNLLIFFGLMITTTARPWNTWTEDVTMLRPPNDWYGEGITTTGEIINDWQDYMETVIKSTSQETPHLNDEAFERFDRFGTPFDQTNIVEFTSREDKVAKEEPTFENSFVQETSTQSTQQPVTRNHPNLFGLIQPDLFATTKSTKHATINTAIFGGLVNGFQTTQPSSAQKPVDGLLGLFNVSEQDVQKWDVLGLFTKSPNQPLQPPPDSWQNILGPEAGGVADMLSNLFKS